VLANAISRDEIFFFSENAAWDGWVVEGLGQRRRADRPPKQIKQMGLIH